VGSNLIGAVERPDRAAIAPVAAERRKIVLSALERTGCRCWECEDATERPFTVRLRTSAGVFGPLLLCPDCYDRYYVPLASRPAAVQMRGGYR
jgi:hypothetical protein